MNWSEVQVILSECFQMDTLSCAYGAKVEAAFYLHKYTEVTLIVGQNGKHPKGVDKVGSGGSFVVIDRQLLIAAGGAGAWNRK